MARSRAYSIRTTFRAPLSFAFRWCTDYSEDDPRLEKERFQRRVLSRTSRHVVFEDLYDTPDGWSWTRYTVTRHPPNRWHADAVGSHRAWSLNYTLRELKDGRTELTLRGVRTPTPLGGENPSKAAMEGELRSLWRNLGAALEFDYRFSQRSID